MKKKLLLSIAALALVAVGVTGCQNDPSSSLPPSSVQPSTNPPSSVEPSTPAPSTPSYPEATVKLNQTAITIEVGQRATIRATVTTTDSNRTCDFSVEDSSIVTLPANTSGLSTITVTGKAIGTTTITAAAVANPNSVATVTVTVIAAKPTLPELLTNLSKLDNYTVHAETEGEANGKQLSFIDEIQVTDKAIVYATSDDEGETFDSTYRTPTDVEKVYNSRYGLQVLSDNTVVYLDYDATGKVINPAERAKDSSGFLTPENFTGAGSSYGGTNDLFGSLAAINPSYFSDEKENDNVYEVAGTQDDYDAFMAEMSLLQFTSPTFYQSVIGLEADSDGRYYPIDVATGVETTVEVLGDTDFKINFAYGDILTSTVTLTKVGETSITHVPSTYATDIASLKSTTPELNPDLVAGVDALKANNYVRSGSYYLTSNQEITFNLTDYYTEDYLATQILDLAGYRNMITLEGYAEILADPVTVYQQALGSAIYYLKEDGKAYFRPVGYKGILNDGTPEATLDYVVGDEQALVGTTADGQQVPITKENFYIALGYVGSVSAFEGENLYAFSDSEEQVFTGIAGFATDSLAIGVEMAEAFGLLDQILGNYPDTQYFKTILDFNKTDGKVTSASIYICFSSDNNSFNLFEMTLTNIGSAQENTFDPMIREMIAGTYNPAE